MTSEQITRQASGDPYKRQHLSRTNDKMINSPTMLESWRHYIYPDISPAPPITKYHFPGKDHEYSPDYVLPTPELISESQLEPTPKLKLKKELENLPYFALRLVTDRLVNTFRDDLTFLEPKLLQGICFPVAIHAPSFIKRRETAFELFSSYPFSRNFEI